MNPQLRKAVTGIRPYPLPFSINKLKIQQTAEDLFGQMFSVFGQINHKYRPHCLQKTASFLLSNISRISDPFFAENALTQFYKSLPGIQEQLLEDAHFYSQLDPAAKSLEEVLLSYPGFFALSIHRLAHAMYCLEIPLIPRIYSEYVHSKAGIDIHPGTKIGKALFLDHGTGTVIGETSIIGDHVKIYHGVTLGAKSPGTKHTNIKRHPTIEDNVCIYSGATILGGNTIIGHNSIIGAGTLVSQSIKPNTLVIHKRDTKILSIQNHKT